MFCERVAVVHAARLVEIGPVTTDVERPREEYMRTLIASAALLDRAPSQGMSGAGRAKSG